MWHVMRDIKKKWACPIFLNELHGSVGVPGGKLRLVRHVLNDSFAFDQRQRRKIRAAGGMIWPHVIGIRQAEVFIETLARWEKVTGMAEMPFSVNGGSIAARLQEFGHGNFVGVQRHHRTGRERALNPDAIGITASHQRSAGGGADGLANVE